MPNTVEGELSRLRVTGPALYLDRRAVAVGREVAIALAVLLEAGRVPVEDLRREAFGQVVSRRSLRSLLGECNTALGSVGAMGRVLIDQGAAVIV